MKFEFEKLDVYQKAVEFANLVFEVTQSFPQEHRFGLADQMRRAALSIALNIAESSGAFYKKEKKQFLNIARRSCFECVPALRLAVRQRLLTEVTFEKLYQECFSLSSMISGLLRSTERLRF